MQKNTPYAEMHTPYTKVNTPYAKSKHGLLQNRHGLANIKRDFGETHTEPSQNVGQTLLMLYMLDKTSSGRMRK